MLNKIPLLKKILNRKQKNFGFGKMAENQAEKINHFLHQKQLDQKLVHLLNKKRLPSVRQAKYLFSVISQKEKRIILALILAITFSLIGGATFFYLNNFLPIPRIGGEYTEGLFGAPQYINPLLCQTNDADSDISRLIFSGLMRYDNDLNLVTDLASSYEISEDGKAYTFVLRDNLKWHDGEPITANDVVFTFTNIKDTDYRSPLLISFRGVEIEKIDEKTVRFILPDSYPSFLEVLTVGLLPEHIWSDIPAINANLTEYNLKPVGSGPWKFKAYSKDKLGNIKSYSLVPNPDYHGQKPYLQKLNFKFYPDFDTALSAIKSKSVDGLSFLPKELKSELGDKRNLNYYSLNLPQYSAIFFNQKANASLKDVNVRKALALSVDKQQILNEALQQQGKIINYPILPVDLPNPPELSAVDPALAEKLLAESGYKKIDKNQYLEILKKEQEQNTGTSTPAVALPDPTTISQENFWQKGSEILTIKLITVDQAENTKAAEIVKAAWEKIGVKVDLQIVDGGKIVREVIKPRNYEALLFGIIVGSTADPYPFWHSSQTTDPGLNLAQLADRDIDKILEDVKNTKETEKQKELYQQFVDILRKQQPAIFLYNPTYAYVTDKKIKGLNTERIIVPADRFNNLSNWYINTKRVWHGTAVGQ